MHFIASIVLTYVGLLTVLISILYFVSQYESHLKSAAESSTSVLANDIVPKLKRRFLIRHTPNR